jgi:hypothetical protein
VVDDASRPTVAINCACSPENAPLTASEANSWAWCLGTIPFYDRLQRKRAEIGSPIEGVNSFNLLKLTNDDVRYPCRLHLSADFKVPLQGNVHYKRLRSGFDPRETMRITAMVSPD